MEMYGDRGSFDQLLEKRIEEHIHIFSDFASDRLTMQVIGNVSEEIIKIFKNKGGVYLCGNGGSAADAQHIAAELVGRFYAERIALNAEALSVNTSAITAIANDYSYEQIFVRQLEAKARPNDMVIGISTSGTSANILNAISYAKKNQIKTVLLTGGKISRDLKEIVDYLIQIPATDTPRIQEAHIFVGHLIAEYVECYFKTVEKDDKTL